jgi:hypothetical protein
LEIQRLAAAIKEAKMEAAANYETLMFEYTAQSGQKWINLKSNPLFTGFAVEHFQATINNVYSGSEAKELGIQEKDIVEAIIVLAIPPQTAPVWEVLSQGLQSAERRLEKASGENRWSTDGAVSQEILQHNSQRDGVAWNVDQSVDVPAATIAERQSMQAEDEGGEDYFEV